MKWNLLFLVLGFSTFTIKADQPVHCNLIHFYPFLRSERIDCRQMGVYILKIGKGSRYL